MGSDLRLGTIHHIRNFRVRRRDARRNEYRIQPVYAGAYYCCTRVDALAANLVGSEDAQKELLQLTVKSCMPSSYALSALLTCSRGKREEDVSQDVKKVAIWRIDKSADVREQTLRPYPQRLSEIMREALFREARFDQFLFERRHEAAHNRNCQPTRGSHTENLNSTRMKAGQYRHELPGRHKALGDKFRQ